MITIQGFKKNELVDIPLSSFVFSGGEVQVKIESPDLSSYSRIFIHAFLHSSEQVMKLFMVTDAIRQLASNMPINLVMPYIPYARQDRVCDKGEALGIKVFANLINAQGYSSVLVWDAHSEVSTALIDRCVNVKTCSLIHSMPIVAEILVSPDAGANKKVFELAKAYPDKFTRVIRADKTRDVKTGAITGTEVYCEDLKGQSVLIVDDIGDGLRTFVELGKKLKEKNAGKVILFITHGIFSKGVDILEGSIDIVYSANIWKENVDGRNKLGILRNMDGSTWV